MSRKAGARAEQASLEAKLERARAAGDVEAERTAASQLARTLAGRGAELDTAIKLARRALILAEDAGLREELSSWFAGLGEPALGAATLRPLADQSEPEAACHILTRIAVLLARSGDEAGAAEALLDAGRADKQDPVPAELLGSMGAWASDVVGPELAAKSYLTAAKRHEARGARPAAFENLLRAFEMAPSLPAAAEKLAAALAAQGRVGAADEVMREHAMGRGETAREIHVDRMRHCAALGDVARALGAALDAGLEREIDAREIVRALERGDAPEGSEFDQLLDRAGLHELCAARLEFACDTVSGARRGAARLGLGRLYMGPLASPDRAVEAWLDGLCADPANDDLRAALRGYAASTRDHSPLLEALIRVALSEPDGEALASCLLELSILAEQRLSEPALALWATRRLNQFKHDPELAEAALRLAPRVRMQNEVLENTREELATRVGDARVEVLRRLASMLRGRPDEVEEYLSVLRELTRLLPQERAWQIAVERVLERLGRVDELIAFQIEQAEQATTRLERERALLALAARKRQGGDPKSALSLLMPLFVEPGTHAAIWATSLLLASELNDLAVRAEVFQRLAAPRSAPIRAMLLSIAAEALLDAGDIESARNVAERAAHVDPSLTRPASALARAALKRRDRIGVSALERAMAVAIPKGELCRVLAESHEALGETSLAIAWTQRWLALRPGDPDATRALLRRTTESGDAGRLGDALTWLLSQSHALAGLIEPICLALERLAELAPPRAVALSRRALDVCGPREPRLASSLIKIADRLGERSLAVGVMERQLAAGSGAEGRGDLLLKLAHRRREGRDADGAARALVRALAEGADANLVLAELEATPPGKSSDGELALITARAEALSMLSQADIQGTARAWRELGAARYDLAGDPDGAVRAWERAAALDPERGIERLAKDLVAFGGAAEATQRLESLATRKREPKMAARVLGAAASVALSGDLRGEALTLAARALALDPSFGEMLAIVERAAGPEDLSLLNGVYSRVADASLGCYGERAAHYRAARQLERRGAVDLALEHAIRAFEAVPAEGVTFVLMARLAERDGQTNGVVAALERVASQSRDGAMRSAWLQRAALFAGETPEGKRQRVDVLLRALAVHPNRHTILELGKALVAMAELGEESRQIAELRFERAVNSMLRGLEGPEGARVALAAAEIACDGIELPVLALAALSHAASDCSADIDEYSALLPRVSVLVKDAAQAAHFVQRSIQLCESPHANVERPFLELAGSIAAAAGRTRAAADLMLRAARKAPDDVDLVQRAEQLARASGDTTAIAGVLDLVPARRRAHTLLDLARAADKRDETAEAIAILEQLGNLEGVEPAMADECNSRLRDLYSRAGRRDALERLLSREYQREDLEPASRSGIARDLAAVVSARGEPRRAISIVDTALGQAPDDVGLLSDLLELSRQADDDASRTRALARLADLADTDQQRLSCLRELAQLLDRGFDTTGALSRWTEVLALDPNDPDALMALERDAEQRSDYETLVSLLGRRANLATRVDDVRRIRLRRATVLEQRLGRADDARTELEALLASTGDNLSVLRVLADLNERLHDRLRAAPLWLRASAVARDKSEAAELSQRACSAYLAAGDTASARRVLSGMQAWTSSPDLLELAVEIERGAENAGALGDALEELAAVAAPARSAELLLEAAQVALGAGGGPLALDRAERAARAAPRSAQAQLLARALEYAERGAGTPEEARVTCAELRGIDGQLDKPQTELRAFLIAEALDVAVGSGAGMRELSRAHAEIGAEPLIAFGMAKRMLDAGEAERALPLFDRALAGELRDVVSRGRIALAAVAAAEAVGDLERALAFAELAAAEPDTRAEALALRAQLAQRRAPQSSAPDGRYAMQGEQAPVSNRLPRTPALTLKSAEEHRPPPESAPPSQPIDPGPNTRPSATSEPAAPHDDGDADAVRSVAPSPILTPFPFKSPSEGSMIEALAQGSAEAGRELVGVLERDSSRKHELLNVCRRLALLTPGDRWVLSRLHEAALADQSIVYARAIQHVLRAFDAHQKPIAPPPLYDQPEEPELVRSILFRDQLGPAAEALALVWEGAEHVFRRDPSTYGVTGLERVPLGAPTPLARAYSAAARVLGLSRTPLFQRKSSGAVTISVALLSPPALILSGEVTLDSSELYYHMGSMLVATLPEHVLLFGSPASQAQGVLKGLSFAFGPPGSSKSGLNAIANLAEVLWESVPARSQRRLRELCDDSALLEYEVALAASRQALRRAGLFACGDLGMAVREACTELGIMQAPLSEPDGLATLSAASPVISDLVRLATSAEYAEARWQPPRSGGRHSSGNWAKL